MPKMLVPPKKVTAGFVPMPHSNSPATSAVISGGEVHQNLGMIAEQEPNSVTPRKNYLGSFHAMAEQYTLPLIIKVLTHVRLWFTREVCIPSLTWTLNTSHHQF